MRLSFNYHSMLSRVGTQSQQADFSSNQATSLRFVSPLQQDTVCFTGNKEAFLSLPKSKIIDRISKSVDNLSCFLGKGEEARVYRIEDTDYCVRLPYQAWLKSFFSKDNIPDLDTNISEREKANHVVAKFGDDIFDSPTIMNYIESDCIDNFEDFKKKVLKMPQEAFDNLYTQVCEAANLGLALDLCGENILLDSKNKKMTAVDFYDSGGLSYSPLNSLLYALSGDNLSLGNVSLLSYCAKNLLTSVLKDFKPNQKLRENDVENYNFKTFLWNVNDCIDSHENYVLIKTKFKKLQDLKSAELRGENVASELNETVDELQYMIDKYFIK